VVFILAAVLISDLFQSPIDLQLREESQRILETVASGIGLGSFIEGKEVRPEVITELLTENYDNLRGLYGAQYDFCIYFEDQNGKLIMINEDSAGLGDPSVNVSGLPCGIVPVLPIPGGCDADGDTFQSLACGGTDCEDTEPLVHPGVSEICNLKDDDCDLIVDESCISCTDVDGDTYSDIGGMCGKIDCNDADATINPAASEICEDGIDQDCSGADLAPCPVPVCEDTDGDGYFQQLGCGPAIVDCCDLGSEAVLGCTPDTRSMIFPGSPDVCEDGVDQDCDGADLACPLPGGIVQGEEPVLSCVWQGICSSADKGPQITLFKATATSNAHAGISTAPYVYSVCCDVTAGIIGHGCTAPNGTTVLKLSASTNAHAQVSGTYPVPICLNATGSTPSCVYRVGATCAPDETCIASLSDPSNAVLGNCGVYADHLCCKVA